MKISKISFLLLFFISALSSQNKNISIEYIINDQLKDKTLESVQFVGQPLDEYRKMAGLNDKYQNGDKHRNKG